MRIFKTDFVVGVTAALAATVIPFPLRTRLRRIRNLNPSH